MKLPIYLDHNATTPLDPRVLEAMLPVLGEAFGNAASAEHRVGWQAAERVEIAREEVAAAIGCEPREIVFTSGATESNNLALKGICEAYHRQGDAIVTVATEHPAVLDPCATLERRGVRVTRLAVGADGRVDPAAVEAAIDARTVLVSVMVANHEIGTLQPIEAIGRITRRRGVLLHCDAAQAVGKVPLDVRALGIDLLSISAHKLYGPQGIGALYVRARDPRVRLVPQMDGGGHEQGRRSGTTNLPGVVGLGAACRLAGEGLDAEAERLRTLAARFLERLRGGLPEVRVNGSLEHRLPGQLHLTLPGVPVEELLVRVRELAVSSGSACASARPGPSHVLEAIGMPAAARRSSFRIGIGRFNTAAEIDFAAERLVAEARRCGGSRQDVPAGP
ncbi:MAG: aminotransferase class V-fold PLP-dependent enzyme [Candidatus Eiseniibacteriota bacterium]|jgi:cysteine desulfurase